MRRRAVAACLSAALVALLAAPATAETTDDAALPAGVEVLSEGEDSDESSVAALEVDAEGEWEVVRYSVPEHVDPAQVVEVLGEDPDVVTAEVDGTWDPVHPVTNGASTTLAAGPDPLRGHQWHLDAIGADSVGDRTAAGTVLAVLDTGVAAAHPDLAGLVLPGWDFVAEQPTSVDGGTHGTFVAGMATAGHGNGTGVAALAPDLAVLPGRVCSTGCRWSDVAEGIVWATNEGADVVNLSLGGTSYSSTIAAAVLYARWHDVVVVASAGNSGEDGNPRIFPASNAGVVAVGAVGHADALVSWSSSGDYLDLAAPGVAVASTLAPDTYGTGSGTSYSAPQVAAAASIARAAAPHLVSSEIEFLLESSARDAHTSGWDEHTGAGVLDLPALMAAVDAFPAAPASVDVSVDGNVPTVSWPAVPGVWRYDVHLDGDLAIRTAATSVTLPPVTTDVEHTVEVTPLTATRQPGSASVSTTFGPAPAQPVVSVSGTSDSSLSVTWTALPTAVAYELDLDGVPAGETTSTSHTFGDLAAETEHVIGVTARDSDGIRSARTAVRSTTGATPVSDPAPTFSDVPANTFFTEPVGWARSSGYTTGVGGTNRFQPHRLISRAEAITLLWRVAGEPVGLAPAGFSDLRSGAYYARPVDWAAAEGLTRGVGGSNRFEPEREISRAELVTLMWRQAGSPGAQPSGFVDVAPGSFYATAVAWAKQTGVTTGVRGAGAFEPDRSITRAETVTMLHRAASRR